MNYYRRKLYELDDLVFEKESDYVEMLKESCKEVRKKPDEYYREMVRIRKTAWINAAYLQKIMLNVCVSLSL